MVTTVSHPKETAAAEAPAQQVERLKAELLTLAAAAERAATDKTAAAAAAQAANDAQDLEALRRAWQRQAEAKEHAERIAADQQRVRGLLRSAVAAALGVWHAQEQARVQAVAAAEEAAVQAYNAAQAAANDAGTAVARLFARPDREPEPLPLALRQDADNLGAPLPTAPEKMPVSRPAAPSPWVVAQFADQPPAEQLAGLPPATAAVLHAAADALRGLPGGFSRASAQANLGTSPNAAWVGEIRDAAARAKLDPAAVARAAHWLLAGGR